MYRASLVLLAALTALAAEDYDKKAEISPGFLLGSRYGRSMPRVLVPRNDKFFMGSRYGKRSPPRPSALRCTPAGAPSLYRCTLSGAPPYAPKNYGKDDDETLNSLEDQ